MGLFNNFAEKAREKATSMENKKYEEPLDESKFQKKEDNFDFGNNDFGSKFDDLYGINSDNDDDINMPISQKPESFHHFILENQYSDIEMLVRGFKNIYDKNRQKWVTKRRAVHCFTDEEAEEILRTIQGDLSTDIKLSTLTEEEYRYSLGTIGRQLRVLFREIMEYRYGRYKENEQMQMKQQANNILRLVLFRIKANYSRAVGGKENRMTHESVKAQESLQNTERNQYNRNSYT